MSEGRVISETGSQTAFPRCVSSESVSGRERENSTFAFDDPHCSERRACLLLLTHALVVFAGLHCCSRTRRCPYDVDGLSLVACRTA